MRAPRTRFALAAMVAALCCDHPTMGDVPRSALPAGGDASEATSQPLSRRGPARPVQARDSRDRGPARPIQALDNRGAPQWVTPAARASRVRQRVFDSAAAKAQVSYHIYTPELYDTDKDRRFPVLYWLHGSGGGQKGIAPLAARFDAAIRAGQAPPMIVVFPNGLELGMWADSKDGRTPVETIFVKELIPDVDAAFRTLATREGRLIEGFSMGGYGAARLGFKHPDLFAAVSILAGGPLQEEFTEAPRVGRAGREKVLEAVFGGDHEYFKAVSPWVLAEENAATLRAASRIRVVIGDRDEMLAITRKFDARLTALAIPHAFTVLPGVGHNPMKVLDALGDSYWRFHRDAFVPAASSAGQAGPAPLP